VYRLATLLLYINVLILCAYTIGVNFLGSMLNSSICRFTKLTGSKVPGSLRVNINVCVNDLAVNYLSSTDFYKADV